MDHLELIGDGTRPYALPTLDIKNDCFKRIDAATLVKLIDGHYSHLIPSFTILDCRYPYEYHGGHIVNSVNVHTASELINLFIDTQTRRRLHNSSTKDSSSTTISITDNHHQHLAPTAQATSISNRHILIFHCEFSSERGPRLMRLLREKDRQTNKYPQLFHPELYLLEGGYRQFYKLFKEYCVPQAYKPMKSRNHRDELSKYRKRRKMAQPRRKENRTPDISFEAS